MTAGEALEGEFSGSDLEDKMKEAGIVNDDTAAASDILAKLKAKKSGS